MRYVAGLVCMSVVACACAWLEVELCYVCACGVSAPW